MRRMKRRGRRASRGALAGAGGGDCGYSATVEDGGRAETDGQGTTKDVDICQSYCISIDLALRGSRSPLCASVPETHFHIPTHSHTTPKWLGRKDDADETRFKGRTTMDIDASRSGLA